MRPFLRTESSSRLYYKLLQRFNTQLSFHDISKRCLTTVSSSVSSTQNETSTNKKPASWVFDPFTGSQPVIQSIPHTSQSPSSTSSSTLFSTTPTLDSTPFSNVFTSMHSNLPRTNIYTLPLFDPSFLDTSKNASAEEITNRIQHQLSKNSGPWRLFGSTVTKHLESSFIKQKQGGSGSDGHSYNSAEQMSLQNKGMTFIDTDRYLANEYNYISTLVSAQYRRNMLIRQLEREKKDSLRSKERRDRANQDTITSTPSRGETNTLHFNFSHFRFLAPRLNPTSRSNASSILLKRELFYVSEMIRLYQISGIEELKQHVEWTTPLVRRFAAQFSAPRPSDERILEKLPAATRIAEEKNKMAHDEEIEVYMEAIGSAYMYLMQSAQKLEGLEGLENAQEAGIEEKEGQRVESVLSPLYSSILAKEFQQQVYENEEAEPEVEEVEVEEKQA